MWQGSIAGQMVTEVGYGDNGVAEGAGAPTNSVAVIPQYLVGVADLWYTLEGLWKVPASKYLYCRANVNAITVMVFGIEIPD